MSELKEYRDIEKQLDQQLQKLERFRKDGRLADELALERKLSLLLNRYSLKKKELINFLSSPYVLSKSCGDEKNAANGNKGGKSPKTGETRH
ncbi:hypothetical protein [Pseudomonas viridiflava]|uniref:hypothetical protein n=1 Tax=Pseudomonas viridiflava TaxID=33069 RepID=UPI0018E5D4A1|nr:hypothetical protein [Pseudomonas viridiflava]MBI6706476.1 hypothetical protein [Pseudomonas viridiflava]MBI6725768.1 hypothetical protein [Pseudomonas viridiflava]